MSRAFRNTPAFWSDLLNSRRNTQLKFENTISLHEILAWNESFSRLFWKINIFLILFDHKCYTWFESSGTVENSGSFGFEFTLDKSGEIILSGFRFDTVSHSWHLLVPQPGGVHGRSGPGGRSVCRHHDGTQWALTQYTPPPRPMARLIRGHSKAQRRLSADEEKSGTDHRFKVPDCGLRSVV
jgi:hypothetical protein